MLKGDKTENLRHIPWQLAKWQKCDGEPVRRRTQTLRLTSEAPAGGIFTRVIVACSFGLRHLDLDLATDGDSPPCPPLLVSGRV